MFHITLLKIICINSPNTELFDILFCHQLDINECGSLPCLNGGNCVDGVNGYECRCQPGYTGIMCETSKWTKILEKMLTCHV